MGNSILMRKRGGGDGDVENTLATLATESAAKEARKAVLDAVQKAQKDVGKGLARDPEAAKEVLVAGVLPLSRAQDAAASGAKRALDEMARDLEPAKRLALDFNKLKDVASVGASSGVKAAGSVLVGQGDLDQEVAAAAAATGAWIMCCFSVRACLTLNPNASKYIAILGNLLGGTLPASAALYHLLSGSSEFVRCFTFGCFTLGVFAIASGLIAGHFGNSPQSVVYTKIATIIALVILLAFFSVGLCTLFKSEVGRAICGSACGFLILLLVIYWTHFDW